MANHNNLNGSTHASVNDRIRKNAHREYPTALGVWRTQAGVGKQQRSNALEFRQKPLRYHGARFLQIKIQGLGNILLGVWME